MEQTTSYQTLRCSVCGVSTPHNLVAGEYVCIAIHDQDEKEKLAQSLKPRLVANTTDHKDK